MSAQLILAGVSAEDAASRVARETFAAIQEARKADPEFRLTEKTLGDCLRPALAKEMPKAARIAGRNVLFDALADGCGLKAPFTDSAGGQVAKALKEIRAAFPEVAADDLKKVAATICRKYEGAGPMAVSSHFHEFYSTAKKSRTKKDNYVEPPDWKRSALAQRMMHASDETWQIICERGWFDLAVDIRASIWKAFP